MTARFLSLAFQDPLDGTHVAPPVRRFIAERASPAAVRL
jgi:hypothetical protein